MRRVTVAIQTEIGNFGGRAAAFALTPLFSMTACNGVETEITNADQAENANRITRQGVYPGVWVDLVQTADGERKGASLDCKLRVSQYMQGLVGMVAVAGDAK
jgi:hypothetical protein